MTYKKLMRILEDHGFRFEQLENGLSVLVGSNADGSDYWESMQVIPGDRKCVLVNGKKESLLWWLGYDEEDPAC